MPGWVPGVLLAVVVVWAIAQLSLSHRKRINLVSYNTLLLLNDGIRSDHREKLTQFIKTSDATSAPDLSRRVSGAVERMADGLANDVSGSSLPGAHAAVWALKQGSQ